MANKRVALSPGARFGRWTIISEAQQRGIHRFAVCRCDCGAERQVKLVNLRHGGSLSCGCLKHERAAIGRTAHGKARTGRLTPEYRSWQAMIQRCTNPHRHKFEYYGGRGIKVCERWRHSFESFVADVGLRPSSGHSLDRYPNCDGDYEPTNVRWATRSEQAANRRPRKRIDQFTNDELVAELNRRDYHNPLRTPQHH